MMLKERGIKMSSVIDQSDDSEFIPESLAKADLWYQRYQNTMGGAPQEEEDCTVEQLSALNKRVHTLDLPPYVDLGVWQPYGRRALGASKFRAWFPDGSRRCRDPRHGDSGLRLGGSSRRRRSCSTSSRWLPSSSTSGTSRGS